MCLPGESDGYHFIINGVPIAMEASGGNLLVACDPADTSCTGYNYPCYT